MSARQGSIAVWLLLEVHTVTLGGRGVEQDALSLLCWFSAELHECGRHVLDRPAGRKRVATSLNSCYQIVLTLCLQL